MTHRSRPVNQGLFSLALASRGLAPTHIRTYEPTDVEAGPKAPSLANKLTMLAVALIGALGVVTVPPGT